MSDTLAPFSRQQASVYEGFDDNYEFCETELDSEVKTNPRDALFPQMGVTYKVCVDKSILEKKSHNPKDALNEALADVIKEVTEENDSLRLKLGRLEQKLARAEGKLLLSLSDSSSPQLNRSPVTPRSIRLNSELDSSSNTDGSFKRQFSTRGRSFVRMSSSKVSEKTMQDAHAGKDKALVAVDF
eukprot:m.64372 g.64372  ORF g.64372 m.64372 type:complete len:185 (+) comp23422_c0_seq1:196-750(+)